MDKNVKSMIYYNLYLCYLFKKDLIRAKETIDKEKRYIEELKSDVHTEFLLSTLKAYEYLLENNYNECHINLEKAQQYAIIHEIDFSMDTYNLVLGSLYAKQGMETEAKNLLIPLSTLCESQVIQNRADEGLEYIKLHQ